MIAVRAAARLALLPLFTASLLSVPPAAAAEGGPALRAPAPAEDTSTVFPRFTLELGYPQGVAAAAGLWIWLPGGRSSRKGLVTDAELGLGGASFAAGPGVVASPAASYERSWSFGVQGLLHRTWPWWSAWLPKSSTYACAQVFAHLFAFRCSAGMMWEIGDVTGAVTTSRTLIAACGLGTP